MTDEQTERDYIEGRLNEAKLCEACQRFVELGDDGVFMTCDASFELSDYRVSLKCKTLKHAQAVHQALINIVRNVRDCQPAKPKPTRISE